MFCRQAVCKTVVPDTFRVLLSQQRRWINSTIHNLAELLLVRDICGTFCFSMSEWSWQAHLSCQPSSHSHYLIRSSVIPGGPGYNHPSYSPGHRPSSSWYIDRHYLSQDCICWLDVGISYLSANMERSPAGLCFLAF